MSDGIVDPGDLLDDVILGSGRGGRRPPVEVDFEIARALTPEDLPILASNAKALVAPGLSVREMRSAHHQLAQLLARGKDLEEVALISGYSPAYISMLRTSDPAFQDLMGYYEKDRELLFVDVLARMEQLGQLAVEELQSRLALDPAKWSNREVMELAELMAVKARVAGQGRGSPGQGGPALVEIKFVQSPQAGVVIEQPPGLAR